MIGDLDAELAQAEQKAQQLRAASERRVQELRAARQRRKQELLMRLAALEAEHNQLSFQQQERRTPDANSDPHVKQLCDAFHAAEEDVREAGRAFHHSNTTPGERSDPKFYQRRDQEMARLREASRAARVRYEAALRAKHDELTLQHEEAKLQAAARAAELRQEVDTLRAELQRLGDN
jgi:hypothetical protein